MREKKNIADSHIWKKLKRKTKTDKYCLFCGTRVKDLDEIWKYESPYRIEYAHRICLRSKKKK